VKSVTGGGRLILNTAFPRALLPLSSVITAFLRFLPTLVIYIPVHVIAGLPFGPHLLWIVPLIGLMFVMASGAAMLVSALQVYFRDVKNFLPYFLRVWLYASPVLYYAHEVPDGLQWILAANPLGGLLEAWSDVIVAGASPETSALALAVGWSFGIFLAGFLFFVSREREFAVRL
jgi:teichoic acid transport system permease protein